VANGRSGSLSVIEISSARVVAEHDLGRGLADLAVLADGRHLLAVDRAGDALLLVELGDGGGGRGGTARVVGRRPVSPDPVSVAVLPDGSACAVASLGTRRLTFVELSPTTGGGDAPALKVVATLDLPFSPRALTLVRGGSRLVVADAYGGRIAVVDPARGSLEAVRALPAHNIGGLAATADGATLVLTHQSLRRLARTSFEDIHWGSLVNNHLRVLRVDAVLGAKSDADLLRGGRVADLGGTGNAAGDPAGLALDGSGGVAVALAGVNEVALGAGPSAGLRRVTVGRRPTALAFSADGKTVYVADTFDDSVTAVDAVDGVWLRSIGLGPRPDPDAAERGERSFFDARLSHDGWMSCHSCHTDGHTNGLVADTLGDGSYGAPKKVPSLLGVGTTGPWTWTGSIDRLEEQVRKSIETTMHGASPTDAQTADLTTFLRGLQPPRPAVPGAGAVARAVERGREVFRARGCAECHAGPEYTSRGRYDVGLADEAGNRKFNPPSLRGVGRRESLLHDGRAATLEDVFRTYQHPGDVALPSAEVGDLVEFLRTL
jgi:DNA-binding beta-propeller fold protein YncE/mono/diheme cytochrome c family protein